MATTPKVDIEAEIAQVSLGITKIDDMTASGGGAIMFGTSSSQEGFIHPGIHTTKPQFDYVKARLTQEPWLSAYNKLKSSSWGSLSRIPKPVQSVECGNGSSTKNIGCDAETGDATAAYTQALLWYFTGNQAHANKSIELMNAWSYTLETHPWDGTSLYGNNKLQAGWAGANWTRAAEIIRYSNAGWQEKDIAQFESMLTNAYLPLTIDGWQGFNWVTLLADVTMSIGVFTNNREVYENGVSDWRTAVPQHIYMSTDATKPSSAKWNGATTFTNGHTQETCRDLGHTGMGIASIMTAAETARIQGTDLYAEQAERLIAALEFQSSNIRHRELKDANSAYEIPSTICGGTLNWGGSAAKFTGEVGYNHFAIRQSINMPFTAAFLQKYRPLPVGTHDLHMQWETLTNANVGNAQ